MKKFAIALSLMIALMVGFLGGFFVKDLISEMPADRVQSETSVAGIYYTTNWRGGPATLELYKDGTCKGPIGTAGTYACNGDKVFFHFQEYAPVGTIVDDGIMYESRFFEKK